MWYASLLEPPFGAAATGQSMAKGRSLSQFQETFPDEASCVAFLLERRWPNGFVCPRCGERRAAALKSRAHIRMPCLQTSDFGHRGHGDASLQAAADGMVLGRASHGDAFQRHVGAAIGGPTRRRL